MKPGSNSDFSKKLSAEIKIKARELGFDLCGISVVKELEDHRERLVNWLNNGYNARMTFMARNTDKRTDPSLLVENSKSVIIVGLNYFQSPGFPRGSLRFSKYALGKDYHGVLKDKLYSLFDFIKSKVSEAKGRVCVDSAPVLEKAWAVESGIGWVGKNSLVINKGIGSYIFLGEIITNVELESDRPLTRDHCGTCNKCIEACPTKAILDKRIIDASKCISYHTVESRDKIPSELKGLFEDYVFGCDICQSVCPWNNDAMVTTEKEFKPVPEILNYSKEEWQDITKDQFNSIFRDSSVLRTGYKGFMQNLSFLLP